jgi:hypothetical protein
MLRLLARIMKNFAMSIIVITISFASSRAVAQPIWQQDFATGIPPAWVTYEQPTKGDFVNWYQGEVSLFKQALDTEPIILATEELDISDYTRMEFDVRYLPQAASQCEFHIGLVTDSTKVKESFELIRVFTLDKTADRVYSTKEVNLKAYPKRGRLAFKLVGVKWDYINLDNIKLYNDVSIAKYPMGVGNFAFTPAPNGLLHGTFRWTNPSKQVDGGELTDLDSIVIEANGLWLCTKYNPAIGKADSMTSAFPAAGFYSFIATAYNDFGKGYQASYPSTWVGLDVPEKPVVTSITCTDGYVELRWTPPTAGLHGLYFDGIVTQYIIRRADSVVSTVDGAATLFTEKLPTSGSYNYTVASVNNSGEGGYSSSDPVQYLTGGYLLFEEFWINAVTNMNQKPAFPFIWASKSTTAQTYWRRTGGSYATGKKGELMLWPPSSNTNKTETIRILSPVIDSRGYANLTLEFKAHIAAATGKQISLKLETTKDAGFTTNLVNTWDVTDLFEDNVMKVLQTSDLGSQTLQFIFSFVGNPIDISEIALDNFRLYSTTRTDLKMVSVTIPAQIVPGRKVTPQCAVLNNSTQSETFDVRFSIVDKNSKDTVYRSVKPANVDINRMVTIDGDTWTAVEGEYTIQADVVSDKDQDHSNDSRGLWFNALLLQPRKVVVMEEFTGTWCVYCPGAAMAIEDLFGMNKPIAVVAFHDADKYETRNVDSRKLFDKVSGYPTTIFNGRTASVGGSASQSIIGSYLPIVDSLLAIQTPVLVDLAVGRNNRSVTATASITSPSPIRSKSLVLHAALTESDITVKWQNQDKLHHVERFMYPDVLGTGIDLSDKAETVTLRFSVPDSIALSQCELMVFVQDTATHEVYDGAKANIGSIASDVAPVAADASFRLYPNPVSTLLAVETSVPATVAVYNLLGVQLQEANVAPPVGTIDVDRLVNGRYWIVMTANNTRTARMIQVLR